jgi:RNA-directed DNA polymerase
LLNIESLEALGWAIGITPDAVEATLSQMHGLCRHYQVFDPAKPHKAPRDIFDPQGTFRRLQKALYKKLFLPNIDRSPYSHGGVPGRGQLSHVKDHIGQTFVYTLDIESYYPSIKFRRVHRLFCRQGCSEEVARVLTRICTYNYHLAQGFITSPIIADMIIRPVDDKIVKLAEHYGLKYSRFVDDITLSAKFDINGTCVPKKLNAILENSGFHISEGKIASGRLSDGVTILNLRLDKPYPDVTTDYYQETVRRLKDHASLGADGEFRGPFYTRSQLFGRLRYILSINVRRWSLVVLWKSLNWPKIMAEAKQRGILARPRRLKFKRVRD